MTGPSRPAISVIVPAFQPGPELGGCIRCLLAQEIDEPFEILVVDNGSDPPIGPQWGSAVRIVNEPTPGSYAARNAGIAAALGRVFAFTDADCLPEPSWLGAGVRALSAGQSIVTGTVELFADEPTTVTELYEFRYGFPQDRYLEEGFGVTANLFVDRRAIEIAGPFDAGLRSGGDREFGQRLARNGFRTEFAPDAIVRHPARRYVHELLAKASRTAASTAVLRRRRSGTATVVRQAVWLLRPPLRAFWQIIRDERHVPRHQRVALCGLVMLVRLTVSWAYVRVLLGATPPR